VVIGNRAEIAGFSILESAVDSGEIPSKLHHGDLVRKTLNYSLNQSHKNEQNQPVSDDP